MTLAELAKEILSSGEPQQPKHKPPFPIGTISVKAADHSGHKPLYYKITSSGTAITITPKWS